MKRIREDLELSATPAACKQSLSALEKSVDKLSLLIGEKLALLDDGKSKEITERYISLREQVHQLRRKVLQFTRAKED